MKDDDGFEGCLIDAVKKQPILYDRNALGYSNKECIENAWIEACKEVSKYIKNINVTHCKLRWRTLRDRFVKQIAKTPDGVEHLTPEANRWEYTTRLSFLTKHLKKRKCEETFVPINIKKEPQATKRIRTNSICSSKPHSFSFVDTKSICATPDSNHSHIPSENESQESNNEPEIEMPQSSSGKRKKFNEPEFPLENYDIQEGEHVTANQLSYSLRVNLNENRLNKLLTTTNELLQQQIKQNARRSPNEAYFKVLDGYFTKLPPDELDRVKVEILNLIILKKRTATKRQ